MLTKIACSTAPEGRSRWTLQLLAATNATEQNGDVVYAETAGSYDPVNPTVGDTSVANMAVNSFNGIVFGLFVDDPFATNPGGSYTISNLRIADFPILLGDVNRDNIVNFLDISPFITVLSNGGSQAEADLNGDGEVNFLDIAPFITFLAS